MNICSELPVPSDSGLPADAVICVAGNLPNDSDSIAQEFLAADELSFFRAMKAIVGRKSEWLLGRIAVKSAISLNVRRTCGADVEALSMHIRLADDGKPFVEGVPRPVSISISHAKGVAVAVAWAAKSGTAGIDIEFPRKLSDSLIADTFTPSELALVGGSANALKLWCLKESAAKATGEGIRFRLQNIAVISLSEMRSAAGTFAGALMEYRGALIALANLRVEKPF